MHLPITEVRRGIIARIDLRIATIRDPKQIEPNEYVIARRNEASVGCFSFVTKYHEAIVPAQVTCTCTHKSRSQSGTAGIDLR